MKTELRACFSGNVQGCGFRYYTFQRLRHHPVSGYVKNKNDGQVELVLQGDRELVLAALDDVKTARAGRIQSLELEWREPAVDLVGFEIRY